MEKEHIIISLMLIENIRKDLSLLHNVAVGNRYGKEVSMENNLVPDESREIYILELSEYRPDTLGIYDFILKNKYTPLYTFPNELSENILKNLVGEIYNFVEYMKVNTYGINIKEEYLLLQEICDFRNLIFHGGNAQFGKSVVIDSKVRKIGENDRCDFLQEKENLIWVIHSYIQGTFDGFDGDFNEYQFQRDNLKEQKKTLLNKLKKLSFVNIYPGYTFEETEAIITESGTVIFEAVIIVINVIDFFICTYQEIDKIKKELNQKKQEISTN